MLEQKKPHELDADTINYYHDAVKTDAHGGGVDLVSIGIYENHLQLWTWTNGDSKMVAVSQVINKPDGYTELLVRMLAGRGGMKDFQDVVNAFTDEPCLEYGCDRVIAFVKCALWEKFKEHGVEAEEVYTVIGKDSKHGSHEG